MGTGQVWSDPDVPLVHFGNIEDPEPQEYRKKERYMNSRQARRRKLAGWNKR